MTMHLKRLVHACLACVVTCSLTSATVVAEDETVSFGIEIVPLAPLPQKALPQYEEEAVVAQAEAEAEAEPAPEADPNLPVITPQPSDADGSDYWTVYQSIPFLRSEYNANPSYRHEGTIELILKQVKPVYKTINVTPSGGAYYGSPYSYRRGQYYRGYMYPYRYYRPWTWGAWPY